MQASLRVTRLDKTRLPRTRTPCCSRNEKCQSLSQSVSSRTLDYTWCARWVRSVHIPTNPLLSPHGADMRTNPDQRERGKPRESSIYETISAVSINLSRTWKLNSAKTASVTLTGTGKQSAQCLWNFSRGLRGNIHSPRLKVTIQRRNLKDEHHASGFQPNRNQPARTRTTNPGKTKLVFSIEITCWARTWIIWQ